MRSGLARRLGVAPSVGVAVALAAVIAVAPAGAASVARPPQDESLLTSGSITVTWQAEPAPRCASAGLCGVQGALIIVPQSADALSFGRRRSISLEPASTTVRVLTNQGGTVGECIDVPPGGGGGGASFGLVGGNRHRLVARFDPSLSSGRCAGPIGQDLARLRLPVRESGGRRPSFDVRTSQAFAAGPFLGRLTSTLVLRPGNSSSSSGSSSYSTGPPPRQRHRLFETARLRYRVSVLPDALQTSFAGESDPFCGVLDSCGATGTISLAAAGPSRTLSLSGSRPVARRVSRRQVIADLRRGRLALAGSLSVGLMASETFVRADGSRCQDSLVTRGSVIFGSVPPRDRAGALLNAADPTVDALRTHCPGPAQADVFGANAFMLAQGPIDIAQLLRSHSTLILTNSARFSGLGYAGSRAGEIGLSLSLEGIRAGTVEIRR